MKGAKPSPGKSTAGEPSASCLSGRVAMKASLSLASLLLLSPWPLGYAKGAVEIKELRRNGRALGLLALDHCGEKVDREGRESGACEGGEAK